MGNSDLIHLPRNMLELNPALPGFGPLVVVRLMAVSSRLPFSICHFSYLWFIRGWGGLIDDMSAYQ